MAIIRGQGDKKFAKFRTDVDVPAIARPQTIAAGISLTSSADIDNNNPENLYFHILGALPQQIILYLYGERFNQNFYTEIGQHLHSPGTLATGNVSSGTTLHNHGSSGSAPTHNHQVTTFNHVHGLYTGNDDGGYKVDIDGDAANNSYRTTFPTSGQFIMAFAGQNTLTTTSSGSFAFGSFLSINNTSVNTHGHTVSSGQTANLGLLPGLGSVHSTGTAKQFFSALKIAIDGVDKTALLLAQTAFAQFGDGTSGHGIVVTGAQLDLIPFITTPGQHKLTFSLNTGSPDNGGKVRYNLYTIA